MWQRSSLEQGFEVLGGQLAVGFKKLRFRRTRFDARRSPRRDVGKAPGSIAGRGRSERPADTRAGQPVDDDDDGQVGLEAFVQHEGGGGQLRG